MDVVDAKFVRAGAKGLLVLLLALEVLVPASAVARPDIVVLPFANYTGRHEAFEKILPALTVGLEAMGLTVVDPDSIRPTLRRHRIRSLGQLGSTDARTLRDETGARFVLLGSLDLYEPDTTFEVSLSARLLDLESMELVGATSMGLTVQETEQWFGTGRVADVDAVVARVVDRVLQSFRATLQGEPREPTRYHTCGLVAVVPFDDHSESRYAAEILQSFFMAAMVGAEWRIVEPGFVHELLLDHQSVLRGGVTSEVLELLRAELGVCWVVTGEVETFRIATDSGGSSVPTVDFGLRLVDARNPRLVSTLQLARDGAQGEGLFGRGREYSIARVVQHCMEDITRWMHREGDRQE